MLKNKMREERKKGAVVTKKTKREEVGDVVTEKERERGSIGWSRDYTRQKHTENRKRGIIKKRWEDRCVVSSQLLFATASS